MVARCAATIRTAPGTVVLSLSGAVIGVAMTVFALSPIVACIYFLLALVWAEQRLNCWKSIIYYLGSFGASGLIVAIIGMIYQTVQ